jgi:hypothetical protein
VSLSGSSGTAGHSSVGVTQWVQRDGRTQLSGCHSVGVMSGGVLPYAIMQVSTFNK